MEQRDLKLKEQFPKILKNLGGNPSRTCMSEAHGGIAVGDGWIPLLEKLFRFCQFNHDKNGYPQLVADQIKEKFGTLRFYFHMEECDSPNAKYGKQFNRGPELLEGAISFAELMSGSICEICGNPGESNTEGWLKVRCKECSGEQLKEKE